MCTAHTNFSDDALVNAEIKNSEWRKLLPDLQLNLSDLKFLFDENYELHDAIIQIDQNFSTSQKLETKEIRKM